MHFAQLRKIFNENIDLIGSSQNHRLGELYLGWLISRSLKAFTNSVSS